MQESKAYIDTLWRSPDGVDNAAALRAAYPGAFAAIAELDALGHRTLQRAASAQHGADIDALVGLSMLRRAVTHFVGIRHLFEASAVEQAKVELRAQFETLLAFRYLVHGGRKHVPLETPSSTSRREARARYFYVAAERRKIYTQQALLDGRFGPQRVQPENRRAMRKDTMSIRARLEKHFPAQSAAFGPLRCFHVEKKKRRYHNARDWYSFGFRRSTVNNIRALAKRLGWIWEYEVLYDAFSGLIHPRGISHDAEIVGKQLHIFSPYMADAFQLLCKWSCHWQLYVLTWAIKAYHPGSLSDAQRVFKKVRPSLNHLKDTVPSGLF